MAAAPGGARARHHARDATELAEVLDALGLTAAEGRVTPAEPAIPQPRTPVRFDDQSASRLHDQLRDVYAASHRHTH